MSLELGHFQPEIWLLSPFICLKLHWFPNEYPSCIHCPFATRLSYRKIYLITSFSCLKIFAVPSPQLLFVCLNISTFQHVYLSFQPQWMFTNNPKMYDSVFVDVGIFPPFVEYTLNPILNWTSPKKYFLSMWTSPLGITRWVWDFHRLLALSFGDPPHILKIKKFTYTYI